MENWYTEFSVKSPRYVSAGDAAYVLGYEYKYFAGRLSAGKVKGAFKYNGRWYVPADNLQSIRKRSRVTKDVEAAIQERLESGIELSDIPGELKKAGMKVSKSTVYNVIHRGQARRKAERETPDLETRIIERLEAGEYPLKVLRETGITEETFYNIMNRHARSERARLERESPDLVARGRDKPARMSAEIVGRSRIATQAHIIEEDLPNGRHSEISLQAGDRVYWDKNKFIHRYGGEDEFRSEG